MVVALEAKAIAFSPTSLSVPADTPFQIAFSNADDAIPHNVTIPSAQFSGKIITGVSSVTYAVSALAAGTYQFGCIVHPSMSGTLTVR